MKKTVIVGYGNMGSQYADRIYAGEIKGLALYGILCRNRQGQERIRRRMPQVQVFGDEESMFAQKAHFDALIITTPHKEHIRVVEHAQKEGLSILCEKPFGVTAQECAPVAGMTRSADRVCAMMFNWRAREVYRQAHDLLQEGRLGALHQVVWTANFWYRPAWYHYASQWRSSWNGEGGGLLINQSQHLLDMWNWLFGQPVRVRAKMGYGCYSHILVDDKVSLFFLHDNGMWGNFITSSGDSPGSNRLEIHGELGKLVVEADRYITIWENEVSTSFVSQNAKELNPVIPYSVQSWEVKQEKNEYTVVLQNFADALEGRERPLADFDDGLRALENANAAYLSDWQNREVEIPCDSALYVRELEKRMRAEERGPGSE